MAESTPLVRAFNRSAGNDWNENTCLAEVDRFLDDCEARVDQLAKQLPTRFGRMTKVTVKRSYDLHMMSPSTSDYEEGTRHIGETLRTDVFKDEELVESYLETLGVQLGKNQEPLAYLRAKQELVKYRDGRFITSLIIKVREKKHSLTNWDRVTSCLFGALKELQASGDIDYSTLASAVDNIGQDLSRSQPPLANTTSDTGGEPSVKTFNVEATAADARLVKRLLEILPEDFPNRIVACHSLSSQLVTMSSPLLRAVAVDLAVMSPDLEHIKRVTKQALEPDAHRLVEEAVRRLVMTAGEDKTKERSVGYLLIDSLMKHRPQELAYISRTAKKFGVVHLFEGLDERGELERVKNLIKQGVNKAFGFVTLKPEKKYIVASCLVEEGFHLTARRLIKNRPADDIALKELFNVEIDDDEAERERLLRLETCVRVPDHVNITIVDSVEKLMDVRHELLNPQLGPVSMDVEWQPELNSGHSFSPAQIIQIARPHAVFLLDVAPSSRLVNGSTARDIFYSFMRDLVNSHEEVWGFGLEMDCKVLAKSFPDGIDWCNHLRILSRNIGAVPHESLKSLAERVLGRTLDKEQQMSNWGHRPLLPEQIEYAATDAFVLLELHRALFGDSDVFANSIVGEEFESHHLQSVCIDRDLHDMGDASSSTMFKFFCDETLKRVAKMLRAVSVDCEYEPCGGKRSAAIKSRLARSRQERRIFVTADPSLRNLKGVYVLQTKDNEERFHELVERFNIPLDPALILLRCTKCNGPGFDLISKEEARQRKPDIVTDFVFHNESIEEFYCCNTCENVVWQGPKFRDMFLRMGKLIDESMKKGGVAASVTE